MISFHVSFKQKDLRESRVGNTLLHMMSSHMISIMFVSLMPNSQLSPELVTEEADQEVSDRLMFLCTF